MINIFLNAFSAFVRDVKKNKRLVALLILVFASGLLRDDISAMAHQLKNLDRVHALVIFFAVGSLFLPTAPLNIVYGAIYDPLQAAVIVSGATTLIICSHVLLRALIPVKPSRNSAIIGRLRLSKLPLNLKLFLVRSNPVMPLFFTTSLITPLGIRDRMVCLFASFLYTIPPAYVLALSSANTRPLGLSPSLLSFISIVILSLPSAFLSSRLRIFLSRIPPNLAGRHLPPFG